MLFRGNKIEVRIYFFLASTNPLIIYSQNNAHLRQCGKKFDPFNFEKERHVCNVAISKDVTEDYVVNFSLEGYEEYLKQEGIIP